MKKLILFIILSLSLNTYLFGQRCSGQIIFRIGDPEIGIIFPQVKEKITNNFLNNNGNCDSLKLQGGVKIRTTNTDVGSLYCPSIVKRNNLYFYEMPTGCGLRNWKFDIHIKDEIMTIDVKNIVIEQDYLLDFIVFKKGIFELDLKDTNILKQSEKYDWFYGNEVKLEERLTHKNNNSKSIEVIKSPYTIQEIKDKFKYKNYKESVLVEFQKSMGNPEIKPRILEYIPGEVIAWQWIDGRFAEQRVYLVQKDSLRQINVIPKDETFLNKLNSYVPEKSRFIFDSDLWSFPAVKERLKDGTYLIRARVTSYNSRPMIPNNDILNYNLEYKTKDFEKFELIRLKDFRVNEWIEVKEE